METLPLLKQYISNSLMPKSGLSVLDDKSPLIEEGIIDSLGILSLLNFIQETFSVEIRNEEITPENFETPLAISRLIEGKLSIRRQA